MEKTLPPAIVAAGIGAAGAIGGGLLASSGASKAANAQTTSDAAAIAEQQREFNTIQQNFAPYLQAGTGAMGGISGLLGLNGSAAQQSAISALQQSPMYQSLYRNGNEAILQDAAATGGLRGGNTQRSLADFGSDLLSTVIQQQLSNLGGLAGLGEGATNSVAGFGQNAANNISSLDVAGGNAQASGALAQSGIFSGMMSNILPFIMRAAEPSYSASMGF